MENMANFTLSNLKTVQPIQGWQDFFEEGSGFLKTAVAAYQKSKRAYTAPILYNRAAMAIEKFSMAALMMHGAMPYNHTMADLVDGLEGTFPGEFSAMRDGLLQLDTYQEICDLEGFSINPPGMEEIPAMLDLAGTIQGLVKEKISVQKVQL